MSEFTKLQRKQAGYHSSVFSTPDSSPTTLHVASVPTIGHDFSKISILPKLEVSQPNDPAEQEADRVAAEVVNQIHAPQPSPIQRQETLEKEDEEELQMKPIQRVVNQEGISVSPDLETSIAQAKGGGQPLDQTIRAPIEQVMGADLSEVKVHTDAQADQLNRSVQARAFTTGQDVFFRQGEYNPGSRGGQELIAHELTHVVQQNGGAVQRSPLPQQQSPQHAAPLTNSVQSGGEGRKVSISHRLPSVVQRMGLTSRGAKAATHGDPEKANLVNNLIDGTSNIGDYMQGVCYDAVAYVQYLRGGVSEEDLRTISGQAWIGVLNFEQGELWMGGAIQRGRAIGFRRLIDNQFFHAAISVGGTIIRAINGNLLGAGWSVTADLVEVLKPSDPSNDKVLKPSDPSSDNGTYKYDGTEIQVYLR